MRRVLSVLLMLGILVSTGSAWAKEGAEDVAGELGQRIDRYMRKAEANGYAGSVLVGLGDAILLRKGYGLADRENGRTQTAETVFSIGSITKQFTGAAILKLEMKGKLSVSDPMSKYLGPVPDDKQGITLHHLLTHTAGLAGALGDDYDNVGRDDFVKMAMASKLLFKPGERYEYSNVGFSLLGIIVEMVSGQGYETFLYENIFKPAGMERTGYLRPGFDRIGLAVGYSSDGERWGTALERPWLPEGPGWHLRANGGILSTVGDMYLWYKALKGDAVLSAAARAKYFAPHVREYEDGNSYYGYGWVTQKTEQGTTLIWHNGGNGIYNAYMGFEPEKGLVIIASSNVAGKISDSYAERIRQIIYGEFKELDETVLKEWAGTYRTDSGAPLEARFDENDNLSLTYGAKELVPLLAASGWENAEETAHYDQRVKDLLAGVLKGEYGLLAAAWGEPVEEVSRRASAYWGGLIERWGNDQGFEVLGTAARPRHLLTYVRVDFENAPRFFTYVWVRENGRLMELRESENLERSLEPRSQSEFAAPAIGTTILFEKNDQGRSVLVIRKGEAEVRAARS